nr:3869_t:CDS:2 [Entrophospora candida]
MEKFCSEIVRRGVHQVVAAAGYDKSSRISCDILTDVYKEYLMALGRSAQENANNVGRSVVNANDILQAFNEYKVNVNELKEWTENDGRALNGYSGVIPNVLKDTVKDDRCESDENLLVAVNATMNKERSNEDIDINGEEETIEDDAMEIEENNITYENTDINDNNSKNNNVDYLHTRPNYIPEWLPPLPNIGIKLKGGMNPDYVIQAFYSLQDQYKFSHSSSDSNQNSKHSLNDDLTPTNSSKRIKLFKQDGKSTKKAKTITALSGINTVAAQSTAPVVKIKSVEKKTEDKTLQPLAKPPVATPIKIKLKLPNPPIITTVSSSSSSSTAPPNCFLDDGQFMVSCDHCQVWFHGTCTGFGPASVEVGTWYCKRCTEKGVVKGVAEI